MDKINDYQLDYDPGLLIGEKQPKQGSDIHALHTYHAYTHLSLKSLFKYLYPIIRERVREEENDFDNEKSYNNNNNIVVILYTFSSLVDFYSSCVKLVKTKTKTKTAK